jgi:hypothetical protein
MLAVRVSPLACCVPVMGERVATSVKRIHVGKGVRWAARFIAVRMRRWPDIAA